VGVRRVTGEWDTGNVDALGLLVVGVLGLLVGTLLTTVAARVPAGESLLHPGSRCDTCRARIAVTDQIPLVSWARLRGRCRICGQSIGWQVPAIEAATALLFAATAAVVGVSWALPALLYLAALTVVASAIDLQHHRLPDAIVLPSYPITLGLLLLSLLGPATSADLLRAVLAGLALFAAYFLLGFINPSGMGGGDIKLAGVLGMLLGMVGWSAVVVGGVAGFFIGAVGGLLLLIVGRAGRKTKIPFGPFMFAGCYVGLLWGADVAAWYLG
jgi:leader peptidase (prepilin peptidase)/N-methyltransferase